MKFNNYLKESSLSRIWRHNIDHDCAALTGFRKYHNCGYDDQGKPCDKEEPILLSKDINKKRNAALAADIKKLGYGVTKVIGNYPEGGKTVKEISYFVVDIKDNGNIEKDITKLGKKYDQDSVLIIPKGAINNENTAYLYSTNSCCNNWLGGIGKTMPFEKGKLGVNSPIYTTYINGRPFIFESCELSDILFGSSTNAMMADQWSKEYERYC